MGETSTIDLSAASPLLDTRELSKLHWRCRRGLLENDLFIEQFFARFEPELNQRHAQGLAEFISEQCRVNKFEQLRMEGFQNALWILLDLNDIMVHIMQPEARAEYRLDTLWPKAITVADQREGE